MSGQRLSRGVPDVVGPRVELRAAAVHRPEDPFSSCGWTCPLPGAAVPTRERPPKPLVGGGLIRNAVPPWLCRHTPWSAGECDRGPPRPCLRSRRGGGGGLSPPGSSPPPRRP